jgi:glutathione S-transferase
MSLVLYGRKTSANVQKVMWTLGELDLPFRQIEMGGKFGGLDTPDYRGMNPNSLVPTLKDGEFVLWESHAIVRYLCAKHANETLWPVDLQARALADQWMDWTSARFQPAWLGVFSAVVRARPQDRKAEDVSRAVAAANACFEIMDAQLTRTPYLTGSDLTYADIVAGASLYRWYSMDIERKRFAGVEAWHKRLLDRPAFVSGVCIPYDDLVAH